jgi:hypothetical protein
MPEQGNIFECVCETIKKHELPWTKIKGVITNRAPSMNGKKNTFYG